MEPKTGLLIWWILPAILAMTDGACDFKWRIKHTKNEMEKILAKFIKANGNNILPWPEPISELDLTTEEKIDRARCGLHYMQEAVNLIRQHQSDLNSTWNPIPTSINDDLKHTKDCIAHVIGPCNRTKTSVSSPTATYERKQWGVTVLKISVDFLDELKNFNNTLSKLFKPRHA